MCIECGCENVGSETGMAKIPGGMLDVTRDGEAGLTLNMTATQQERLRFIIVMVFVEKLYLVQRKQNQRRYKEFPR